MAKKLSLLKPELKQKYLRNAVSEHVEYIDVPGDIGIDALQSDIKNGAVHMKELEQLITKKKNPNILLLTLKMRNRDIWQSVIWQHALPKNII